MCLFVFTHIGDICSSLGKSCASCCRSLSPLAFIASLVSCPIALVVVLGAALPTAVYKWVPGVVHQEAAMWRGYCNVLRRGKEAYDGKGKQPLGDCCATCLAEAYCCLLPAFLLYAAFYPLLLLAWLMLTVVGHAARGFCAGAIRKDLRCEGVWWPAVGRVLVRFDQETSVSCYDRRDVGLVLEGCAGGSGTTGTVAPAQPTQAAAASQPLAAPQPQTMRPVAQPVAQPAQAYAVGGGYPAQPLAAQPRAVQASAQPAPGVPVAQPTAVPVATPVATGTKMY